MIYVTDFSRVDYELFERDGRLHMPAPTSPETFAEASALEYVAESRVMGGMGPALHPFSDGAEAEAFATKHGGTVIAFDDINPVLIERLQTRGSGGDHDHDHDHE